MKYKEQSV